MDTTKSLVMRHSYKANPDCPGGFKELTATKGQMLTFLGKHPSNEHWWEVKNEDGEVGFLPASYAIIKEETNLPWLQDSVLQAAEEERQERAKKLNQEKLSKDGKGVGPVPRSGVQSSFSSAVAAIKIQSATDYQCKMCCKKFSGPIPLRSHLSSKAHKEEEEAQKSYESLA